ncbi:hypothetical protein PILCRDRAFT_2283 [Piloderma croceum F 1598]|uniref:DUF7582 domain-containing protein n=1 Tax=Piloderma croceum (strain F 1598) TaxID=765440 RepID=A0A0C3GED6_PILCF|nr:hypothetical protein PILCRDRAFT_2283 [Piloderma croceum F 1598]
MDLNGECLLSHDRTRFIEAGTAHYWAGVTVSSRGPSIEEEAAELYAQAKEQNDIIFKQPSLTVYATPWHYALITKLDRLKNKGSKSYDLNDAVVYLNKVIGRRDNRPVHASELSKWAKKFHLVVPENSLIAQLEMAYAQKYQLNGITL